MTITMEKLFEQIFDRKREIINRAKQQSDSFSQHLAAKLLIAGLTPPPPLLWRNPSLQPNEFKKEELLSHLLQPYPQPTATNRGGFNSLHNQPVALEGKKVVETGGHEEVHESKECNNNLEHEPALVSNINDSEIGPVLNASEQDVSTTALQGQIATRVSDIIADPTNMESHASERGCNLEDRSTPLPEYNNNDVGCRLDFVPELDQSIISPQEVKETRISSNSAAPDQSLFRIQRSKSRQKALELRKTAEKADKIHQRDTNASVVCYDGDKLFSNASKQCQPHQDDESLKLGIYSGSMNRECAEVREIGECLSKEKDANPYCGRTTRSRSSRDVGTHEIKSKLGNSLDIADVEGGKRIRSLNNFVEEVPNPVQISNTSSQRGKRFKSRASGNSSLNFLNGQKECRDQTGPSSELILCCPDTYDITDQKAKSDCLIETEAVLDGPAKFHAACSESTLDGAGPSVLEDFGSRPSSKSRMTVKPKTLDFEKMENSRLTEVIRPKVGMEILDKPLEKEHESANSPALLGEVTFSNSSRKTSGKQSLGEEMSKRISEPWRDSYETCSEERIVDDVQVTELWTGHNIEEISDTVEKIQNSPVLYVKETRSSNAGEDVDMGTCHGREESSCIPNKQVQKCESLYQMVRDDATETPFSSSIDISNLFRVSSSRQPDANDQSTCTLDSTLNHMEENPIRTSLVSEIDRGMTSSDHVLLHEKSSVRDDGFVASDAMDAPSFDGKYFTSDEIRFLEQSSMQGRKLRSTAVNTWPHPKRRKIDSQENKFTSADINFRMKESDNMGGSFNNRSLNSMGLTLRTTLRFDSSPSSHEENATQLDVSKIPDIEMHPNFLIQETGFLPGMPIEQDELEFGGKSQHKRFSPSDKDGECGSFAASSFGNGEAEELDISFGLNARAADAILETNSDVVEDGFHPSCSVESLPDKQLVTSASDQTLPEFDGSIIREEDNDNRHIVGDAFDSLDLPMNIVERASLLEQLCKSAVMHTPVFRYSTTHHKVHKTPDVYQSLPNGVLEHFNPRSTLNSTNDGSKQLRASYSSVNELNGTFHGLHPDGLPTSETYSDQSLKILPTSPVSKLWGRTSSQSLSSEKNLSSNPEHTCFPIEEDPSISEEQEDKDEAVISTQEEICPASMDYGDKRNPLADITQANVNPPPSVSAAKKSRDRSSLDSVNTEINFTGTHGGVKQKLAKRYSNKRIGTDKGKKKLTLSISTNLMGIPTESLHNKLSKPNLSRKTSLRNGGQNVSRRDSKHNNIISNISSFVPLVKQKQTAAVITGKRDVKVKALEAAETARRLEEKKEDERKSKKEALKLERARMEQENLRQAELKRKKKEDDLKKKEADVAARKRLREEEEKKEKEKKRRRFEGKRQQQIEQEEKLRSRKAKKDMPALAIDAKLNCVMGTTDALRKPQKGKVDLDKGDGKNLKKPDSESLASKSSDVDVRNAILKGLEAFGDCRVFTEVTNISQEKSYEISPYQSSDDEEEDDEEDEISPRKYVPAWASKKSLGLVVPSQQNLDPDILFPLKTFCNVDEVSGLVYKKK